MPRLNDRRPGSAARLRTRVGTPTRGGFRLASLDQKPPFNYLRSLAGRPLSAPGDWLRSPTNRGISQGRGLRGRWLRSRVSDCRGTNVKSDSPWFCSRGELASFGGISSISRASGAFARDQIQPGSRLGRRRLPAGYAPRKLGSFARISATVPTWGPHPDWERAKGGARRARLPPLNLRQKHPVQRADRPRTTGIRATWKLARTIPPPSGWMVSQGASVHEAMLRRAGLAASDREWNRGERGAKAKWRRRLIGCP